MKIKTPAFKKDYIRILTNGPQSELDYEFARELIDSNYAKGKYQVSKLHSSYDKVTNLIWIGVNTNGRLFLDELNSQIRKESWGHKLKLGLVWILGVASTLVIEWIKSLILIAP